MNREEVKKLIQQGITELNQALKNGRSETLQRYLDVLSRFHRYSFNNAILIAIQKPDATHVAGFHTWKQLGRSVMKGEKGIGIMAPMVYRKDDDDGARDDNDVIRGFKVVHIWDVSQTDGKELPEFATITGDPGEHVAALESFVREQGIELVYENPGGGAQGVSHDGRIVVHPDMSEAETFAVLVHEASHELLHQKTGRRQETTRTVRETEAEAVAHVVCRAVGMNGTTRSSDYIQLYSGDTKTLSQSLDHIQKTAAAILDGITNHKNDKRMAA